MEEIWKPIVGYEGLYDVSNKGAIKSLPKKRNGKLQGEKLIDFKTLVNGYKHVCLSNKGKYKWFIVHRLVCQAFIPNIESKRTVNHKDGDKLNNLIENLEWATDSENQKHSYDVLKRKATVKRCYQYSKDKSQLLNVFDSLCKAQEVTGAKIQHISDCCSKKLRYRSDSNKYRLTTSAGGFFWSFELLETA